MTITVLDAHALVAYVMGDEGADRVAEILNSSLRGDSRLLMCTVNVGEVLYAVLRKRGRAKLGFVDMLLSRYPIEIVDADLPLARQAAEFKATRKMSYADCFAAALAKLRDAEVVTGDPEFAEVEDEVRVLWLSPPARPEDAR